MNSLVSVIITTYNSAGEIRRCLNSIINQSYKNLEILVCDDGSTDNTKRIVFEVLSEHSKWQWLENPSNFGGPAKGRNLGITHSTGAFIAFCDADDEWKDNKIETQIEYLGKTGFDFCGTNCQNVGASDFKKYTGQLSLNDQIRRNRIPLSSLLLSRSCLSADSTFSELYDYRGVEDYDFTLRRLMNGYKGGVIENDLTIYHFLDDSLSHKSIVVNEKRRAIVLKNLNINSITSSVYRWFIFFLLIIRSKIWNLT